MDPGLLDALLTAVVRSARVFAFVTGLLVVVDSIGILLRVVEQPPHRPAANAFAWLLAAVVTCGVAGFLLSSQIAWAGVAFPPGPRIAVVCLWFGLGLAFTARAITRAHRPWLTALSAFSMVLFGTFIAYLVPFP